MDGQDLLPHAEQAAEAQQLLEAEVQETNSDDTPTTSSPSAKIEPGNRSADAVGVLEVDPAAAVVVAAPAAAAVAAAAGSDLLGASYSVLPVGHPGINTVACNDKLVCSKAVSPGDELCVCEQLFRLVPKAVVTAAGQVPYMGIQVAVELPAGFQVAPDSVVPSVSPELPEEESFRVIAFDEAMCLGYTEEDGVTPRYHFDVAEMRQEPQFRVCKKYFDMKCAAVLAQAPPSENVGEDGEEDVVELPCSALLEQFSTQGLFGDAFDANTVVLGMTACKILGLIMSPPQPAQVEAR